MTGKDRQNGTHDLLFTVWLLATDTTMKTPCYLFENHLADNIVVTDTHTDTKQVQ